MRELGQLEAQRNSAVEDVHKGVLDEDIERVAARLAEAKLNLLSAKTADGGCLIEWSSDQANAFFSMVEPQTKE